MYGVNRDITSIQAILNQIQNNNRIGGANTQIYLCGAPDILGFKVTNLINSKLKRISKLYANTTYVPSVKAKGLYRRLPANKDEKIGWGVDIHHDELEYLKLNNNILEAIVQNYLANHALIELDRILFHLNNTNEFTNPAAKNSEIDPDILVLLYDKCYNVLGDEESQSIFNQRLREYLRERGPHDFFYVNYKTLTESPAKVYKHNY